jgi:predicted dehydrogenase
MKLRVGLVGLGKDWESRHRPALFALRDRFIVTAVCDHVYHRAKQAAEDFRAEPVDGYVSLARRGDVDVVLNLAPQWYGVLPILSAAEAGKGIYCALEWDWSLEDLQRVRAAVVETGVAFYAEFPRRYTPATLRLKELMATCLGQPQILFCHLRRTSMPSHPKTGETVVCDDSLRDLVELCDWCRFVVGIDPTSVFGVAHINPTDGRPDYEMLNLDFSATPPAGSGPSAQLSCGRYVSGKWPEAVSFRPPAALQVVCQRGIAFVDLPATLIWFDEAGRHMEPLESERSSSEQMLVQFYRSVTSLIRDTNSLNDAYIALSAAHAARESRLARRRIDLR